MRHVRKRRVVGRLPARLIYHLDRHGPDRGSSWDEVAARLIGRSPTAVGFDVYDTVLLRELNDQGALLSVLAAELTDGGAWTGTPRQYLEARGQASRRLPGEGLVAWYRHPELAERSDVARCLQIELDLERTITSAVPRAVETLDRLRAAGIGIGFVSDMHLPTEAIAGLLDEHDLRQGTESLFVSGDVGQWKTGGGLFRTWLAAEGLNPADTAYVGNHPFADYATPRSLGLWAEPRRSGNPLRYEERLGHGGVAGAVIAAASVKARLAFDRPGDPAVEIGSAVAGQAMMAFLLGIRARCLADDLRQVVFVARDAELPYRMAEASPKDYWSSIELHYVHGNRLTWTLAGAHKVGVEPWLALGTADEYSFLRMGATTTPLRLLVQRLGFEIHEIPLDPSSCLGPDRVVTEEEWAEVLADERVHELIAERARERYGLVFDYLHGLGLRSERTVLVDVGWRGQSAAAVSSILADVLGLEPINYHFGGYGVRAEIDARLVIERYAFDDSVAPAPFAGVDQCIETFTGAGQPRAIGYRRQASSVVPVFDGGVAGLGDRDREIMWRAAERVAALMPPAERLDHWTDEAPDPEAVVDVLRAFWTNPSAAEGRMATRLLIETDDRGRSIVPVSAPYRLRDLRTPSPRRWRQGSLAASVPPLRLLGRAIRRR